jgi:hypothetical protein
VGPWDFDSFFIKGFLQSPAEFSHNIPLTNRFGITQYLGLNTDDLGLLCALNFRLPFRNFLGIFVLLIKHLQSSLVP